MLKNQWGKVIVQMKYVYLYINFSFREAELHHISMGNTSPDNNICLNSRVCWASFVFPSFLLAHFDCWVQVLYNILSFWQSFLQMLSMGSDGHFRTLVLNSASLWGLAVCMRQKYKSCARWGLTSQGFTKHNTSVMSHSCLDKLGEFRYPTRRAGSRLISCTATPVSADTCTKHAMYLCCSKGLEVTFRKVIRCQIMLFLYSIFIREN